jgi:hypothetical protein
VKVIAVLWCLAWAVFDALNPIWLPLMLIRMLFCASTIVLLRKLSKIKSDTTASAFLLALGLSYPLAYVSGVIIGLIFAPFIGIGFADNALIDFDDPIYLLLYAFVAALQLFIAYRFFKMRRFKRGFPFLLGRFAIIVTMIVTGVVLTIVALVTAQRGEYGTYHIVLPLISGAVIIGVGLVVWISRSIKTFQRKKTRERNEEILQWENESLLRENQKMHAINENLRIANHSLNHRLISMERSVGRLLEMAQQTGSIDEMADELKIALEDVRRLSKEHAADVGRVKHDTFLPPTNVRTIDNLLALFAERFAANNIMFKLKLMGSIVYLTENAIELGKLETMIGDLLQNALVAVNAKDAYARSVMAIIGEVGDYYKISVLDSGIPFEADTLIRLGMERVTTHADSGGSGVGFMKTFETTRESEASLIISENKSGMFSKSITVRFDGENQYIIETYRPDDFPPNERYTVIEH